MAVSLEIEKSTEHSIDPRIGREVTQCRSCHQEGLKGVFSLGDLAIPRISTDSKYTISAPLDVCFCPNCSLLQLGHSVYQSVLFNEHYPYQTGVSEAMVGHVQALVSRACDIAEVGDNDIIVSIGPNTGEELEGCQKDVQRVGFEPSRRVGGIAATRLIDKYGADKVAFFLSAFDKSLYKRRFGEEKAKVIVSIANFYDFPDPNVELSHAKEILDPEGIIVIQQNDVTGMVQQKAFCNVVHEHQAYYCLTTMMPVLENNGLRVIDVETNDVNGGSFRVYVGHEEPGRVIEGGEERISEKLKKEQEYGITSVDTFRRFIDEVERDGELIRGYLALEKFRNESQVFLLGQSTRASTRVQYWGLLPLIDGISERNRDKWGKVSLGKEIYSEEEARQKADIMLVGIWFYGDSVIDREMSFLEKGGKLLFPSSPEGVPYIVEKSGEEIIKVPLREYVQKV